MERIPKIRAEGVEGGFRYGVVLWAMLFAFLTYFCMYAFRKPVAAAQFEGVDAFGGLGLKTAVVIAQLVGYTGSKYLGAAICSSASRHVRLAWLIGCILAAESTLVAFAVLPPLGAVAAFVVNGLCLGLVWGLVVRYLEGRRSSEILLAGLSCSFIIASGIVKDIGRWVMDPAQWGVSESWMPAVVGALFLVPFVISALALDRTPEPEARDIAERTERTPMLRADRHAFIRAFLPGLLLLLGLYILLTVYRDFRDTFGVEIFDALGYADQPAIFTRVEIPVALGTVLALGCLSVVHSRRGGIAAVFGAMILGLLVVAGATLGWFAGAVSGMWWMLLGGLGLYLVYVPFGSILFDRIVASTRHPGNAVFAIMVFDGVGYSAAVIAMLVKDLFADNASHLEFFMWLTMAMTIIGTVCLVMAWIWFGRRVKESNP